MKDRIKKYMDYKNISPGELASLLEVQRSNISHILNGRNMPGAAFIEKFLLCFPDLNARWLLTGNGEMTIEPEKETIIKEIPTKKEELVKPTEKVERINFEEKNKSEKPVSRVVLLFDDGTFIDYNKK